MGANQAPIGALCNQRTGSTVPRYGLCEHVNPITELNVEAVWIGIGLAGGLFFGMSVALEAGHRLALRHLEQQKEGKGGLATLDGAVYGLFGLLMAFTFSGAMARFDARRQLIIQEANCIGTAYKRLDLLSVDTQPPLRQLFRNYLDSRLEVYRRLPDVRAAREELKNGERLQDQIWQQTLAACRQSQYQPATMLLIPALSQMFDIAATRTASASIHPPTIVFIMLYVLALATALLAGSGIPGTRRRNWLHIFGFPFIVSLTVYMIMDIEFPRFGLIRLDAFDRVLAELRQSMATTLHDPVAQPFEQQSVRSPGR